MRFGLAIFGTAVLGRSGVADTATPWIPAHTAAECRYEERKAAQLSVAMTAGDPNAGLSRAISNGIRESQLNACLARVGGHAVATTAATPGVAAAASVASENSYRPMAGCTADSSVLQGGSSYCVK